MENINIAEILKDCPKGMELDCTMWDNVTLKGVSIGFSYPIEITYPVGEELFTAELTEYGCWSLAETAKCVIFPKGKTTWEGFVPPCKFKDGDVVYIKTKGHNQNKFIIIFKEIKNDHIHKHACFAYQVLYTCKNAVCHLVDVEIMRLATEEEKQELFQAIKDNGYKWNAETKTLEKLIVPKFKIGDRIKKDKDYISGIITNISKDGFYEVKYQGGDVSYISLARQDNYELVQDKFDINTLKPFDKVLVRDGAGFWRPSLFGKDMIVGYRYFTACGNYKECIPYENNEHLLGTRNDCDDFYKTWE